MDEEGDGGTDRPHHRAQGRFFLPYQLYYARINCSDPQINDFFAAKREYDSGELFTNTFQQKYAS
jgi:hypothetical protein